MNTNQITTDQAFVMGFVYRIGYECGLKSLACDALFKENDHPRDYYGRFKSSSEQSFDEYVKKFSNYDGSNFRKYAKKYLIDTYRDQILKNPQGLPNGVTLRFSRRGLDETSHYLAKDGSDKWILPRLKEIYTKGVYLGYEPVIGDKHHDVSKFHKTVCIMRNEGKIYQVVAKSKELTTGSTEFTHYHIALLCDQDKTSKMNSIEGTSP